MADLTHKPLPADSVYLPFYQRKQAMPDMTKKTDPKPNEYIPFKESQRIVEYAERMEEQRRLTELRGKFGRKGQRGGSSKTPTYGANAMPGNISQRAKDNLKQHGHSIVYKTDDGGWLSTFDETPRDAIGSKKLTVVSEEHLDKAVNDVVDVKEERSKFDAYYEREDRLVKQYSDKFDKAVRERDAEGLKSLLLGWSRDDARALIFNSIKSTSETSSSLQFATPDTDFRILFDGKVVSDVLITQRKKKA